MNAPKFARSQELLVATGLAALLLVTAWLYSFGLTGNFLLDDQPNLSPLEEVHSLSFGDIYHFISVNHSSAAGRVLPLLTFALQAPSWPSAPEDFIYVNIALHVLNAVLLFLLGAQLARAIPSSSHDASPHLVALVATAFWALHPINVSTVLYIVQRMTELSATFVLLGMLAYLRGREFHDRQKFARGYLWCFLGLGILAPIAVATKENGFLLYLFAFVAEILRSGRSVNRQPPYWHAFKWLFFLGPWLAFLAYLGMHFEDKIVASYEVRHFDIVERLLTQARVLWMYLFQIVLPGTSNFGLFFDDYEVSRSLLKPWQTLPAVLGIVGLSITALVARRHWPVVSFAILWFLAGHSMESTFLPLELVFEHRNYIPSMGLAFAFGWLVVHGVQRIEAVRLRRLVSMLPVAYLAAMSFHTVNQTAMWGTPFVQAWVWKIEHPESMRARSEYAAALRNSGFFDQAEAEFRSISRDFPEDVNGPLFLLEHEACVMARTPETDINWVIERAKDSPFSFGPIATIYGILEGKSDGYCEQLDYSDLARIIVALYENENFEPQKHKLLFILAQTYVAGGEYTAAVNIGKDVIEVIRAPHLMLSVAKWAMQAGMLGDAEEVLEAVETELQAKPLANIAYRTDLARYRDILRKLKLNKPATDHPL